MSKLSPERIGYNVTKHERGLESDIPDVVNLKQSYR